MHINSKIVDFLSMAPRLYIFRFKIELYVSSDGLLGITFTQVFTSISEEGGTLESEDFKGRLKNLEEFMNLILRTREGRERATNLSKPDDLCCRRRSHDGGGCSRKTQSKSACAVSLKI